MAAAEPRFRYEALDRNGKRIRDVLHAKDLGAANQSLSADGLVPLAVALDLTAEPRGPDRDLNFSERMAVIRQLALMIGAGVNLLEALQAVLAGATATRGRAKLVAVTNALKGGVAFDDALEAHATGFPFYVYAMVRAGHATGRLGDVLEAAADQMTSEWRLRRELSAALTYPTFLAGTGLLTVFFIFTQVIPKFTVMLGDKIEKAPFLARLLMKTGSWANGHVVPIALGLGVLIGGITLTLTSPGARRWAYDILRASPGVGGFLKEREIAAWARLCGFAMANGVGLLEAARLAHRGAPKGAFHDALGQFERDLKAGIAVDISLGRHTSMTTMDLSLLRTGQMSGKLDQMFLYVADTYEARVGATLKRLTALVEPITIGFIAIIVGTLALSIMLALTSVYDTIS